MSPRGLSLPERLDRMSMPVTDCGCLIWMGCIHKTGYGMIKIDGHVIKTHRAAWECTHGKIPEKLHVLHRCDTRACINPNHLFIGTNADNVQDKINKNRQITGDLHWKVTIPSHQLNAIRNSDEKTSTIAKKYGVGCACIRQIKNGTRRQKESTQ